jgi:hypothetical protein
LFLSEIVVRAHANAIFINEYPFAKEIKDLYLALECKFGVEEARSWKFLAIIRQLHDFSLTEC